MSEVVQKEDAEAPAATTVAASSNYTEDFKIII